MPKAAEPKPRKRRSPPPPGHVYYEEAALELGMSRRSLELRVAAGEIAVLRLGPGLVYFSKEEIARFLRERIERAGEQPRRRRRVR